MSEELSDIMRPFNTCQKCGFYSLYKQAQKDLDEEKKGTTCPKCGDFKEFVEA